MYLRLINNTLKFVSHSDKLLIRSVNPPEANQDIIWQKIDNNGQIMQNYYLNGSIWTAIQVFETNISVDNLTRLPFTWVFPPVVGAKYRLKLVASIFVLEQQVTSNLFIKLSVRRQNNQTVSETIGIIELTFRNQFKIYETDWTVPISVGNNPTDAVMFLLEDYIDDPAVNDMYGTIKILMQEVVV